MNNKDYEKKCAKKLGVTTNNGSGAVNDDADFRLEGFLVEHKYRNKKTIWADMNWWQKVKKQAILLNRKPALIVETNNCSVIYFQFGDVCLLKHKFDLELITSSRSKYLRSSEFRDKVYDSQLSGKMFIVEYKPERIMIMDVDDFKDIISAEG